MVTEVCFVRHAQPEHMWEDDRTRPLTDEGKRTLLHRKSISGKRAG